MLQSIRPLFGRSMPACSYVLRNSKGKRAMSEKKEKKEGKEMVEVCPVCGSSELYYETGGYVGKVYHCKDCNYIGALVVEADDEMIKAIKEKYEREKGKEGKEGG